jgi:hypothetical protein
LTLNKGLEEGDGVEDELVPPEVTLGGELPQAAISSVKTSKQATSVNREAASSPRLM